MMNKTQSLKNFVYLVGLHIYYNYVSCNNVSHELDKSTKLKLLRNRYVSKNMKSNSTVNKNSTVVSVKHGTY